MNKRVMIIDDDTSFSEELNDALSSSGYDVAVVNDPTTAAESVARTKPDIILLDLQMPKETGFEVACDLRGERATARIPVIAISGAYSWGEDSFLMRYCSFKKWLKKPISPDEIIANIEAVLKEKEENIIED